MVIMVNVYCSKNFKSVYFSMTHLLIRYHTDIDIVSTSKKWYWSITNDHRFYF